MSEFALKTSLPGYLREWQNRIEGLAKAEGLDFFPTVFEILSYDQMNEIAAYGGFPNRYPHWRYGMEYERLAKSYEYGLSKIYEMVINNNPSYAYLLEGNSLTDQKLVMAHVYAHVDFFKNNYCFRSTDLGQSTTQPAVRPKDYDPNRRWIDKMANHGSRVRKHIARFGINRVEEFVDHCLSIENLIDPHAPFSGKEKPPPESDEDRPREIPRLRAKEYMETFINPEEYIEEQKAKIEAEKEKQKKFPVKPERDVLRFLLEHAPLDRWEADILEIVRDEAFYFWPQMQTKIMNEGWACVAPETLVYTGSGLRTMEEVVEGATSVVSDGERPRHVYDRNIIRNHPTIRMRTRRGFTVTGSVTHRVLLADGVTWKRLDELAIGEKLKVSGGAGLWPTRELLVIDGDMRQDLEEATSDLLLVVPRAERPTLHTNHVGAVLGDLLGRYMAGERTRRVGKRLSRDEVPRSILGSPEHVVRAYLRAYFDAVAEIGERGITIGPRTEAVAEQTQLLLLNLGILSSRGDGLLIVESTAKFAEMIGFTTERKRRAMEALLEHAPLDPPWEDEIVSLEPGTGDVYDISVRDTHRYAAAGFVHHNSYWHSKLMTEKILDASEIIDYADNAAGVLATSKGQLNPYKLGIELYRSIEERWNKGQFGKEWEECDDLDAKRHWNLRLGLGRKKIFEVRALYNDVTFIDEFLTPEFAREQKLFSFGWSNRNERYEIESREFKAVKEKLLFQMTNAGNPFVYVDDANFENRGELLLKHDHQGLDLRADWARETLRSLVRMWKRPVNVHTLLEGKHVLLRYDGKEHTTRQRT
jgi:stage V sporulation protein R